MSIRNINEYNDGFGRWKIQVNLSRSTYKLDDNFKILRFWSRFRGKAREWYYSLWSTTWHGRWI